MKGLVAEAYQLKLGKNESNMLRGDKAITALTDAMKKSQVKTAEIIPYLDALMRRDATPGLSIARNSAQAEQNRFENQISTGWDRFTKGGGEAGLRAFWQMAQQMSNWWEENGSALGGYFHATVIGLDAMRLAIMELWKFMATGESTPITEWMKGIGIDVDLIRSTLIDIFNNVSLIIKDILQMTGFEKDGSVLVGLKDKIIRFTSDLNEIMMSVSSMLRNIHQTIDSFRRFKDLSVIEQTGVFIPGYKANKLMTDVILGAGGAVGDVVGATVGAGKATVNIGLQPADTPYNLTATEYERNIAQIPTSFPQTSPQAIAAERTRDQIIWQISQVEVNVNISGSEQAINALSNATNFTKADFNSLLSKNIASQMVNAPK